MEIKKNIKNKNHEASFTHDKMTQERKIIRTRNHNHNNTKKTKKMNEEEAEDEER